MEFTPTQLAMSTRLVAVVTVLMCKSPSSGPQVQRFRHLLTIHSWNPDGVLIGKFAVSGGSNNFAFVPGGMYIFNAYKIFKVTLKAEGRTVRRDFGLGQGSSYD